jgi:phosphotransferase system HPr (HPr) family protein
MSGDGHCERVFTVHAELGLHARPAGLFVMMAKRFESQIEVARAEGGDDWVDGRSILSLLSLAAGCGTRLRVRAEGADAGDAVEALGQLLEGRSASPESIAGGGTAG